MPFRLVGAISGEPLHLLLPDGESRLGSAAGCELVVDHATVSRHHAAVHVDGGSVSLRDLGSRNGTFVDGVRIETSRVEPGAEVTFGKVRLTLEEVPELDTRLGLELADAEADAGDSEPSLTSTIGLRSMDALLLDVLPVLLQRVEAGDGELEVAERAAAAVFEHVPARRVELRPLGGGDALPIYREERELDAVAEMVKLEVRGAELTITLEVPGRRLAELCGPVADSLGSLLRLSAGAAEDRGAGEAAPAPGLPSPPSVVPAVRRLYEQAARVAQGVVGVLIHGESGTGKEVLGRYIHAASPRCRQPFIALNCAALPHDLLEAELFGIEQGVATGVDRRPGTFELAHGGTLFLDEIGDMAPETQARILRVVQERTVYRVGGSQPHAADCRIVAATNRDPEALRADGRFREDLYFRIATWVVELPPLRHRRDDIPGLAAHFLWQAARRRGVRVAGITEGALQVLQAYRWPGNIRQLENEMERVALFIGEGEPLDSSMLSAELTHAPAEDGGSALEERLAAVERRMIRQALQRCSGNATTAAQELGIGRSTLYRRMRTLDIEPGTG
jgi:hypothetical protein